MRKILSIALAVMLITLLCSCKHTSEEIFPTTTTVAATDSTEATVPDETEVLRKMYHDILEKLYTEKQFPDGSDCMYDESAGQMEDNQFAICDVDDDGVEELIISFTTAPLINMAEVIYHYDAMADALNMELSAFPALTYYSDGMILSESAHGHDGFTPYAVLRYAMEDDTYQEDCVVDGWIKGTAYVTGEEYPTDIDTENAGIVYRIRQDDQLTTLSKTDYLQWQEDLLKEVKELDIPYMALNRENIDNLAN